MDELNSKLNSGGPIVTSQIISKLVQIAKTKQANDTSDIPEFKFLKEKCLSVDNSVNIMAADAILHVVRSGDLVLLKSVITDFVTIVTTTKCCSNIVYLINNLLLIDLERELGAKKTYKSSFNLRLPQHPFIIMLNKDSCSWAPIFREITLCYKTAAKDFILHCNQLYKPVFFYALCNPHPDFLITFKQKLWTFIIHNESQNIGSLLSWMQFENRETIQLNSDFLIQLSDLNFVRKMFDPNLLFLWQISALNQLILHNLDPRAMIFSIFDSLEQTTETIILNPGLSILAGTISSCSSVYLLQLFKLCETIIFKSKCDRVTGNIIKSSLLQWIASPSDLISEALLVASSIFSLVEKSPQKSRLKGFKKFYKNFRQFLITNDDIDTSLQMYMQLENFKNDSDLKIWLQKLEKAPNFFVSKIIDFLLGLFLTDFKDNIISSKICELVLKCVDCNKRFASKFLTVILYKLTNTQESELHYQLLKAIPKMAILKNNLQKIISTIQALNKGRNTLKTFSSTLMLDLFKIDNKCYTFLEKILIQPYNVQNSGNKWEFYINRAHILKELCQLKPELYGKEMVAHLSKILNEANDPDGAIACALAIEGITLLCKSEIIDAVTTWATLAPMFKNESRIPVIKSLCCLISEIPKLSYTEAYPKLAEEVIAQLWDYITYNSNDEVWTSAFEALSHFSLEQIVAQTPDDYLDEEIINIRKIGHVVPGHCWIHFLKNCNGSKLQIAGDFLIKMASLEIASYLKFVYQVKGIREPVDYSYLPVNSVVRGISTYIKSHILKWKNGVYKEVYLQCLRIFSQEYSKPLPPLDWCFLQELFHESEAKNFCVQIAAHQVVLSGTARRFIVNYIEAVKQEATNANDVLLIFRNLKYLANTIQPFTLKPFLEIAIRQSADSFKNGDEKLLVENLECLKQILQNSDIQEANKIVIAEIIGAIFNECDIDSKLFNELLKCVIVFPMKCFDEISSPKLMKEIRTEWFKRAVKIRCTLASNSSIAPLNLLNDLIEVGSSFPTITPFLYKEFAVVFQQHKDETECVLWFLELIGQIQAVTAQKSEEREIIFLCNIFILATVVFSGYFTLLKDFTKREDMYRLFPRAIACLLDVNHWSICTTQTLEWFHHMHSEQDFGKAYGNMFILCLQALRHESEFQTNMKWTKYLNVEFQ